jgi:hypothetical protein
VPTESLIGTLKGESMQHCQREASDEVRPDVFSYMGALHNPQRRHSSLDYLGSDVVDPIRGAQWKTPGL